jgi:flagellar motor switch protein FliN/FliY
MAPTDDINGQPESRTAEMEETVQAPAADTASNPASSVGGGDPAGIETPVNMEFLLDIPLEITVELGRTKMLINDMLKLGQGSVIELSKLAGESLEILANQKPIARGEVVVVNEKYGVRLTEVISPMERVEGLR